MQRRKVKGTPVIESIFFLIKVLKDCSTNNKFVFTFVFLFPPPIAISVLAQCEQNLKQFYCSILSSIE